MSHPLKLMTRGVQRKRIDEARENRDSKPPGFPASVSPERRHLNLRMRPGYVLCRRFVLRSEVECSLDQEGVSELDVRQDGWMVH
ncbi:MAG: hypothetical protein CMK92_08305 [Pseudomonas sp.]|nr:hypothetical protein [Pseudomonas sp.]